MNVGRINVNENLQTSATHIYAIGDHDQGLDVSSQGRGGGCICCRTYLWSKTSTLIII